MAQVAGVNGNGSAHGNGEVNGGGEAAGASATATAERSVGDTARILASRSLIHSRDWISSKSKMVPEVLAPSPRVTTREWLVRGAFLLFAMVLLGATVFAALGLLNATEAFIVIVPVTCIASVIIGVYLGSSERDSG